MLLLRKELVSLEEKDSTTVSSSTCLAVPFLKPLLRLLIPPPLTLPSSLFHSLMFRFGPLEY